MRGRVTILLLGAALAALYVSARPIRRWEVVAAAMDGDVATLRAAAAAGWDVKTDSEVLCFAAAYGRLESVRTLLALGASPDAGRGGVTPLMLAAGGGHAGVARCLLESGADPYRGNNEGETARMIAEARGEPHTAAVIRDWEN
jgi:ankyrin repeat protein